MELGAENVQKLTHGSYTERVVRALSSIPAELLHLQELALPLNKKFEPVEHWGEGPAGAAEQLYALMPSKAREYVKRCNETSMASI
eukprot:4873858-Pyramimonas_sp.AAC.1